MLDTFYEVSLSETKPWNPETWSIGCFSNDGPEPLPTGIRWTDDTRFLIDLDAGPSLEVGVTAKGPAVLRHQEKFTC